MYNYTSCPSCKAQDFKHYLTCEDYTVSHEKFQIVSCVSCGFKFTNPIPDISRLGDYYKSEEYISHSDTKKGLVSRLYHLVRAYTLKQKLKLVSQYVSRGTILDYGCGTGMFLKECQKSAWNAVGIEPYSGARKHAESTGIKVHSGNADLKPNLEKGSVSAITLWHVLEHVTDLNETLSLFKEALQANGVLIIAVPNHLSEDANFYKEFWAAYDVPRHLYHFEPKTIKDLLSSFGFRHIETLPMKFDSFYVSLLSEKYKTGHTSYFKAFKQGLRSNLKAKATGNYSSLIYVFKHA